MAKSDLTSLAASMKALAESSKKQKEALEGISSSMKPISLMTGTLTKAVEMLIGSVIGATKNFDAMKIANADLNVNFFRMTDIIKTQGVDIGTITQHSQMQLDLHRIGYKKIDKDLRESLVWLEKTGGQGKDVLKFMTLMSEKGTTLKTQEVIAKKIAEVSRSTGQSARAAISAAQQMGDQMTVLAALGVDESIMEGVLLAIKEMPEQNATSMGKFASQLLNPDDIGMAIHTGAKQAGDELLRATSPAEVAATLNKAVVSMSERAEMMLSMGSQDVYQLKLQRETFVGSGGILAIQIRNAKRNLKASKGIGTGAEVFTNSTLAYKNSFLRVSETLERAAEIVSLTFADKLLGPDGLINEVFRIARGVGDMLPSWRTIADSFISIADFMQPGKTILTRQESVMANKFGLNNDRTVGGINSNVLKMSPNSRRKWQRDFIEGVLGDKGKNWSSDMEFASWARNIESAYGIKRSTELNRLPLAGRENRTSMEKAKEDLANMETMSQFLSEGIGLQTPAWMVEYLGRVNSLLMAHDGRIEAVNDMIDRSGGRSFFDMTDKE